MTPRSTSSSPPTDPVLQRRAQIEKLCNQGKRLGYSLLLAAIMLFLFGWFTRFTNPVVWATVACMAVASVVLIPAIIGGYGVKDANRADQGLASRH